MVSINSKSKNELIKIIVSGKGVIPFEKIDSINICKNDPKMDFFFSEEFFSKLKGQSVNKEEYDD